MIMRMIRRIPLAMLLLVSPALFGSIDTGKAQPITAEALSERRAAIDDFLLRHMAETPLPGLSAVVVKGADMVFSRGYGVEVVGHDRPMTEHSPVAIGSLTKSFTALAVMQLVDQGKVDLKQPITRYLPWFQTADRKEQEITVASLLYNTSGIPSEDAWVHSRDTSEDAIEAGVRALGKSPLVRTPGQSFEYSNENWSVLGAMITQITGLPYSSYLQQQLLAAMDMDRSTTALSQFDSLGVLYGHHADVKGVRAAGPRFLASALPAGSELRVSAENMGHYLITLLNGGVYRGNRVLSDKSTQALFKPGIEFTVNMPDMGVKGGRAGYAMGWVVVEVDGRTLIHHGGDAIIMGSWTAIDPATGTAASLLYNGPVLDAYRYPQKIWVVNNLLHLINGEPLSDFGLPVEDDPTANDYHLPEKYLDRYVGTYVTGTGLKLAISKSADGKKLRSDASPGELQIVQELDFLSESSAVMRNISGATPIDFIMTPQKVVTGATGGPLRAPLRKRRVDETAGLRSSRSADGRVAVMLPSAWRVLWIGSSFEANAPGSSQPALIGRETSVTAQEFAADIQGQVDAYPPQLRSATVGGYYWQQVVWQEADGTQKLASFTEAGGVRYQIELQAEFGQLTRSIREALIPVLQDFELH